jgi:hypothetical protein
MFAGCGGVSEFAADTTAGFLTDAAPAVRAYFDYESAGAAAANGIIQLEGLHRVSPHNERISLSLAQAYVAYAFGWVMDGPRRRHRADLLVRRGLGLGHHQRARSGRGGRSAGGEGLRPSFGRLRRAVRERGAVALLGGFDAAYPEPLGGDWQRGRRYFERALALSKRRSQLHHINFARTYAINAQDKTLFVPLMREVIESGDQGDEVRLSNKVARRRAERYLDHLDAWFN